MKISSRTFKINPKIAKIFEEPEYALAIIMAIAALAVCVLSMITERCGGISIDVDSSTSKALQFAIFSPILYPMFCLVLIPSYANYRFCGKIERIVIILITIGYLTAVVSNCLLCMGYLSIFVYEVDAYSTLFCDSLFFVLKVMNC